MTRRVVCPECGFQWATEIEEDVDVIHPPRWWPSSFEWMRRRVGRITRHYCTACGWEREEWV